MGICAGAHTTSAAILNSVLSLAAIESGAFALALKPTSLRDVASRVQYQLRAWATAVAVTVELAVEPALPEALLCDGARLSQVLTNLASNALKACPHDGSGRVRITLRELSRAAAPAPAPPPPPLPAPTARLSSAEAPAAVAAAAAAAPPPKVVATAAAGAAAGAAAAEGATASGATGWVSLVRVEVADNGCGIADKARLFRPFSQLEPQPDAGGGGGGGGHDSTRSRLSGGGSDGVAAAGGGHARPLPDNPSSSGLGLSIAREIVLQHGGSIGVDSEPGHGATFWVELPLRVVALAAAGGDAAAAAAAAATAAARAPASGEPPPPTVATAAQRLERAVARVPPATSPAPLPLELVAATSSASGALPTTSPAAATTTTPRPRLQPPLPAAAAAVAPASATPSGAPLPPVAPTTTAATAATTTSHPWRFLVVDDSTSEYGRLPTSSLW